MSTDASAEIAARYPCTFLQRKDSGPAQAINRGLEMATGDIVCWLNADDELWSSTTLERVVKSFTELPEVDVITGNGYYVAEDGKLLQPIIGNPDRINMNWMQRGDHILQPATFWRHNGCRLDERLHFCFDWELWIDFWQIDLNVLYLPEYFARYRVHASSLTQQDSASRKQEVYGMISRHSHNRGQTVWCWFVWKMYQLSELLKSPAIKRITVDANKVMSKLSGGAIASA
jgi:glycosyltransferase involved in cell wall biosynthesis